MANYSCPSCEKEHSRAEFVDNECPDCGTAVKFIKKGAKDGTARFNYECVRVTPEAKKPVSVPKQQPELADILTGSGTLITTGGGVPEIWLVEEGDDDTPPRYRMIYNGFIMTGWIYCPHCGSQMHKNMVFQTAVMADEYSCRNCKSKVELVFNATGVMRMQR